jgi:hypothetical protein
MSILGLLVLVTAVLLIYKLLRITNSDGFADFRDTSEFKAALDKVVALGDARQDGRPGIQNMLATYTSQTNTKDPLPESQTSLVNFYTLGCRFAGYLGPYENGFVAPDKSVEYAVKMGCRTFILEIGYIEECGNYFPKVMIRSVQNVKLQSATSFPTCETSAHSSIKDVCQALQQYAFKDSNQGPLLLVLYILELPKVDNAADPTRLLKYYSNIAKSLEPLKTLRLDSLAEGGTYSRQKQESRLLANTITDYNGRVIVLCNVDTSGFRKPPPGISFEPDADLDYWVNLRLSKKQAQLGATAQSSGGVFGVIDTVQSFLSITEASKIQETVDGSKLTWTLCLEQNPETVTDSATFTKLTSTFGINCIPIQIWKSEYDYLYDKTTGLFAKYSYVPKPSALRYIKEPIYIAAVPSPKMDGKGGMLQTPS